MRAYNDEDMKSKVRLNQVSFLRCEQIIRLEFSQIFLLSIFHLSPPPTVGVPSPSVSFSPSLLPRPALVYTMECAELYVIGPQPFQTSTNNSQTNKHTAVKILLQCINSIKFNILNKYIISGHS